MIRTAFCFPRHFDWTVLIGTILLAVFLSRSVSTHGADGHLYEQRSDESIAANVAGFIANRNAFDVIECRYQLRHFSVDGDVEDVALDRAEPTAVADGLFVRDGTRERREVNISDEDMNRNLKNRGGIFDTTHQLLNGERGLYHARDLSSCVLYSRAFPATDNIVPTPFKWGIFTFPEDRYNVDCLTRQDGRQYRVNVMAQPCPAEPHAAVSSSELVGIEYVERIKNVVLKIEFFLSPNHGHLPIVGKKYIDDALRQKLIITDIRRVEGERFYPMRSLLMQMSHEAPDRVVAVGETRVTELTVDRPIDPSIFRVEFAKNTIVRDGADNRSQYVINEPRVVTFDDLDELFDRAAARSRQEAEWEQVRREKAVMGEVEAMPTAPVRPVRFYVTALLIPVVLAALAVSILRRHRRQISVDRS